MLATPKLADLAAFAYYMDWRVVLVGDPLQCGPVVAGFRPHQSAGVVVDDDHQILVATPVGDLVDPDAGQPVEGVADGSIVGHDPPRDRAHRSPRSPHELGRGLEEMAFEGEGLDKGTFDRPGCTVVEYSCP